MIWLPQQLSTYEFYCNALQGGKKSPSKGRQSEECQMKFMKRIAGVAALGAAMLLGSGLLASPAQAGYVVTLQEVGNDVVATGSGPIDLTGLSSTFAISSSPGINPVVAFIATGMSAPIDLYISFSFTGPESFGPGRPPPDRTLIAADSGSGDIVGISVGITVGNRPIMFLNVPSGYVSGNPLSDTATYLDQSLASLGVTPGVYEWTWGTGPNQNFTLIIPGAATIPEPASVALLGTALAGLLLARARCSTVSTAPSS
jgi:hypothetical protein